MTKSWGAKIRASLRLACASATLCLVATPAVFAQGLIPVDFFNAPINPSAPTAVEAATLAFDAKSNVITATGNVVLKADGYTLSGNNLVYNRVTRDLRMTGNVSVRDPSGNVMESQDLNVTGGLKQAFINAMTITAYDGSRITADSADYSQALQTLLNNVTYAPCGECVDAKGRKIGWSVHATTGTKNEVDNSVTLEQPSLALLGIPVFWLPYLWLPDLSANTVASIQMPNFSYSDKTGGRAEIPITAYSSRWTDIILTPTLMSRQGLLVGAEWIQRFEFGAIRVKASGLYQLDQTAFSFPEAQRDWRGAIQTSGEFTPAQDWTVGWSYTAFTDAAYLPDYNLTVGKSSVDEIYATNLTNNTFIDARVQHFNLLGDVYAADQEKQGETLPTVRFDHVEELAPGFGRIDISAKLLGVQRQRDATSVVNGVPYSFGYAGNKQHASLQAGWQKQWIGAGGFVATPYLGGRADVAYYDGNSPDPVAPGETTLWSATPIAAMDVRFPMAANDGSTVHLIEPIGQLVYRGSGNTAVGITNDDAQSFVFDDTNLFSYNRFSGSDRQETGLRANIGGRYQANFANGGYVEVIAGQSFQLAGANAFAAADPSNTAVGSGMDVDASYAVLGAYGSFVEGVKFGGKLQIDTGTPRVARAGLGASFESNGYSAVLDYRYIADSAAAGVPQAQHEAGAEVGVPITEYWTIKGSAYWDLATNNMLEVGGGLFYDDGYLRFGASAARTGPTHTTANDTRFTGTIRLLAPAGLDVGHQY
ncbi:LPS-assembly protein LptD [Devosia epidermidihirudinis]|uniref:LPS-assembly protein LptD n=1 Tax=Devosia epidermidihirudinis TaxID=1293439 RepID=UPI000A82C615|nr:LPS assembly protein LptD [Devosia epidermidihirudinis]